MFEQLTESLRSSLRPIRLLNPLSIMNAVKHPIQSHALMADRETYIIYMKPNDTVIVGGIRFSNVVYVPELQKGWIILPDSANIYDGKPAYLCDPDIPYTLAINKQAYSRDLNDDLDPALCSSLGLPDNLLKLHTDALGQLCLSKWNMSFDEGGGSIMVFLFGAAAGAVSIVIVMTSLLAMAGVLS